MGFDPSSRSQLTRRDLGRFPDSSLFHRVARVVCEAECLPRKELYESWEFARRVRRRFRGGRIVDLACGHALVAHLMLLLDDSSAHAVAIDKQLPASARTLANAMVTAWPKLTGRVEMIEAALDQRPIARDDVVVSVHACGTLTDHILTRAVAAEARVAVLPCCHNEATCDLGGLSGWMDPALAIDVTRAARLQQHGYRVITQTIPAAITPKNRLLMASPATPLRAQDDR